MIRLENKVLFVLLALALSFSLYVVVNYSATQVAVAQAQAPPQAQAPRLPPLNSLPPAQNPFSPTGVRGVGEIDTMNTNGDRIFISISSQKGLGNIRLTVGSSNVWNPVSVSKTFNLDARIAYTPNSGPDQYRYYTVSVPALLYPEVAYLDLFQVRVEVLSSGKMVCQYGSFTFSNPVRVDITLDSANFARGSC